MMEKMKELLGESLEKDVEAAAELRALPPESIIREAVQTYIRTIKASL